jgi:hypothetical protein
MILPGYSDYYRRTIEQHRTGLKLVPGGTGLGKTSGIPDLIQNSAYQHHKFIYCANRKQLIEEMAQMLDRPGSPPFYVVLPRDLEAVVGTLKEHRQAFYELIEDSLFTDNVRRWNEKTPLKRVDLPTVKRACRTLEELIAEHVMVPKVLEEQMDKYAHLILEAFKATLLGANNKRGNSPAWQRLADHPVIQSLFPCIAFKRCAEIRLMAVTLQKAFYGFFDGQKTLNLTRLEDEDGGYVIFLDEFDFLENDLVRLICRAAQISDPFRVVELFYRAMTRHKLPLETYPLSNNIRNRIEGIKGIVDRLQQEDHLHFPDINQFTSRLPQKVESSDQKQAGRAKTSPAIFRTQHTISTDHLYLCETNRAFEITSNPDSTGATPILRCACSMLSVRLASKFYCYLRNWSGVTTRLSTESFCATASRTQRLQRSWRTSRSYPARVARNIRRSSAHCSKSAIVFMTSTTSSSGRTGRKWRCGTTACT